MLKLILNIQHSTNPPPALVDDGVDGRVVRPLHPVDHVTELAHVVLVHGAERAAHEQRVAVVEDAHRHQRLLRLAVLHRPVAMFQ